MNKVLELETVTLSADREPRFLTGLLCSSVQKGHKTNTKLVNGDYSYFDVIVAGIFISFQKFSVPKVHYIFLEKL